MSDKQINPKEIVKEPQDVVLCSKCGTEYNRLAGPCPQCSDPKHADPMWHIATGQYAYRVQSARVRATCGEEGFHAWLAEMVACVARGDKAAQGIRVFHQGKEFSI